MVSKYSEAVSRLAKPHPVNFLIGQKNLEPLESGHDQNDQRADSTML